MKDRKLKDGTIRFTPTKYGLICEVEFELPHCSFLKSKKSEKWKFYRMGKIDAPKNALEIEVYSFALKHVARTIEQWTQLVDQAVKHEKGEVS